MIFEDLLPWIPAIVFLFGIAKWLVGAASNLTKAITELTGNLKALGKSFGDLKNKAEEEHKEMYKELDDHESRIHTLEDWKKYKEGEV